MTAVLDIKNLTKIYGEGNTAVKAVDGVDLRIDPGEIVLLMGPSGSGKTTFLSMAGLLLTPTKGKIFLMGKEINPMSSGQLANLRLHEIGFVFQAYNLLEALSARENVEIVLNMTGIKGGLARRRALELLEMLGIGERSEHRPAKLSGGEKQRVAIARALANNAPLILADEPTGNLDSKTGREVMELLCCGLDRDKGRAILIVTHDQRLQDMADRILWLEDGILTEKPDLIPSQYT